MSSDKSTRTLYLCYFWLREPLVQTQVLPYLRQLVAGGVDVTLLTFEPQISKTWTPQQRAEMRAQLAAEGIRWYALGYHKWPSAPATLYDILRGAWTTVRLVRRHNINVLHARVHVPLAMALLAQKLTHCRLVFDLRGLMAEEYASAGVWRENSLVYRAVKKLEGAGLRRADQIIVLTRRIRDWLVAQGLAQTERIEVIPCCVDFERFAEQPAAVAPAPAERFELIYTGSVTGVYMLEEMARFFLAVRARRAAAFLRILTKADTADVTARLQSFGLDPKDFWVGTVRPSEVPQYLRRASLGVSFRKATFAQIAASPTKIPEYLAAGLPVVSNAGIGDTDELLERDRVGVVLKSLDDVALAAAAESALALVADPTLRARCMQVAYRNFDLCDVGGRGYRNVYRRIQEQQAAS